MSGDSASGTSVPWPLTGWMVVLSLAALALPLIVVLLQRAIPALGRTSASTLQSSTCSDSAGSRACTAGRSTSSSSWPSAMVWGWRPWRSRSHDGSSRAGAGLFLVATALLLFVGPMLATAWAIAWHDGLIPGSPWGELVGNHGPWYRLCNLRLIVEGAILLPLAAPVPALLALVVRPTLEALFRASVLLGASLLAFLVAMGCCYWLLD